MTTYIYQLPDWPNFYWNESVIADLLIKAYSLQGRLLGRMEALGSKTQQETFLNSLSLDAIKSSAIEGETLDWTQVRSSIARRLGIQLERTVRSSRHVDGVVAMIIDATQNFSEPMTNERLYNWHINLLAHDYNIINLGTWRDDVEGPMEVVSGPIGKERVHFRAPDAKGLSKSMNLFLEYANSEKDDLIKAAVVHLWFVTLHPFEDGNGRITRALTDWVLARTEQKAERYYSMSAQICDERKAYYAILETTQKGNLDITAWISWFLNSFIRTIEKSISMIDYVIWKTSFFEKYKNANLNPRQTLMLNKLFEGFNGKLTSSKWAKITKCSHDTALRDIQNLIELGILRQDKGGGRSTSYSFKNSRT